MLWVANNERVDKAYQPQNAVAAPADSSQNILLYILHCKILFFRTHLSFQNSQNSQNPA